MKLIRFIFCYILVLSPLKSTADSVTVYFNGDIITMEGDTPKYVEAVLIQGDRILFCGGKPEAWPQQARSPS